MIKCENIAKPVVSAWSIWDCSKRSQKSAHRAMCRPHEKSKFPRLMLAAPTHCKRVSTQQGCCHPFSVPQESTRIEWNIRNVIEYLISTLRLLDTQHTAWLLRFTASQPGFSEWQRSMLTVSEKPCRSMWHFAMTWSMTRTGSRGIKLNH